MLHVLPGDRLLTAGGVVAWFAEHGQAVHRDTVRRWMRRGWLGWVRRGHWPCTTERALLEFLGRGRKEVERKGVRAGRKASRQAREAHERAIGRLREEGVL